MKGPRQVPTLLQRYEEGGCVGVWRGIHNGIVTDPGEAMQVARATMRRVRRNAEVLAGRLAALGWHPLFGTMVSPRTPQPLEGQAEAEAMTGAPLPLAMVAFWEEVGGIDFIWDYDRPEPCPDLFAGLSIFDLDPLCIDPARLTYHVEMWQGAIDQGWDPKGSGYTLELAPDDYHKDNISGGDPYGLLLPDRSIDPTFVWGRVSLPLTTYLRLAFRWGGFPGLAFQPQSDVIDARVAELTAGLEPF